MDEGGCIDALTKVCALCLLCFLCSVESSRWFTWVVRVGVPSKILKPHSQRSSADMIRCVCFYCTAVYCLFFYLYLFSYFSKLLRLGFLTHYSIHLFF